MIPRGFERCACRNGLMAKSGGRRLSISRKVRGCQTRRKLGKGQAMETKRRPFLHRDGACQIVDSTPRRTKHQNLRAWAERIQEPLSFLETDRCRRRPE